jgi:ATP-dependent RNA helicase RhlE
MSVLKERSTGTIKWYNRKQGFGFIIPDDAGPDLFLHHSAISRSLQEALDEGDRVVFSVEHRKKGPAATALERLDEETPEQPNNQSGKSFAALGLNQDLLRAVAEAGYDEPTPIQAQAIPHVLAGRDVLGCAQTGTGKTAAFALPVLQRLAEQDQRGQKGRKPRALVLAPTRELAIQIAASFSDYGSYSGLKNTTIYGGVGQNPQVRALRKGVDIVIATPGRLLDLMGQGHVHLDQVEVLILDEADRMLDMGFLPDVRRIVRAVAAQRQTLLFSATMPAEILALSNSIMQQPQEVSVAPEQPTVEAIEQSVYFVSRKKKQALLQHLLREQEVTRALVFTRTKHGANNVVKKLKRAGISAEPIHGNKSQSARQRSLQNFRSGNTRVLVATDVVARGIDVDEISHVIQYDLPNEPETYVHRIGRTGRAGADGIALSFCAEGERSQLKQIERLLGQRVEVAADHPHAAG